MPEPRHNRSMSTFEEFLEAWPPYAEVFHQLEAEDRKLAFSASAVHAVHGDDMARVAMPLIGYARERFGPGLAARYAERCRQLEELQKQFDLRPCLETLGAPDQAVDRDTYHLALLLSIVFTNHRFEILQQLEQFLRGLGSQGKLAGLGIGTGYEIKLAAEILPPAWEIEGYDIDPTAEGEARHMLGHFGVLRPVRFGAEFPIDAVDPARLRQYSAIVACEVLEHLPDPARALRTMREYLTEGGRMFVTMAVNIAQEDHIFLYPDIAACRRQLVDCGLKTVTELITIPTLWPPPADREKGFKRGNYVAVVERA
jgi:hypothetical protein